MRNESKYLLTGMAVCAHCGGALTVRSRSHGRERKLFYHCLTNVTRGRAICGNDMITLLEEAEAAVRETFERHVLREDVLTAALEEALRQLRPQEETHVNRRAELDQELSRISGELGRLTQSIVAGGDLRSLTEAMKDCERRRAQLERELHGLDELAQVRRVDVGDLTRELRDILGDWRALLAKHTPQARQILRKLLDGRLTFRPCKEHGTSYYEFTGKGVLDPILTGMPPAIGNNSNDLKRWWPQQDSNPCFNL
jgi:hypothetical protein